VNTGAESRPTYGWAFFMTGRLSPSTAVMAVTNADQKL
jgi:hypothetical protein